MADQEFLASSMRASDARQVRKGTKRFEDKALYTVKERTHSAKGGGHERRKSRGEQRM